MYDSAGKRTRWVYLYSFASVVGAIEAFVVFTVWWVSFRRHGIPMVLEEGYRVFKKKIGSGGSCSVYKGTLTDDRAVTVKRLGDAYHGEQVFWAEVSVIGRINHKSLARMWGFCCEGRNRLLVYEFIENRSLDKHLFLGSSPDWKSRFNFEPKISDFELAKLLQRDHANSEFSRIRGAKGYMAPEWALNLTITVRVDVYSYGVMVLELVRLSNWVRGRDDEDDEAELTEFVREMKRRMEVFMEFERDQATEDSTSWSGVY